MPKSVHKLYVSNIREQITEEIFRDKLSKFGRVVNVWLSRHYPNFGYVIFENFNDAEKALHILDGSTIFGPKTKAKFAPENVYKGLKKERSSIHRKGPLPRQNRSFLGPNSSYERTCSEFSVYPSENRVQKFYPDANLRPRTPYSREDELHNNRRISRDPPPQHPKYYERSRSPLDRDRRCYRDRNRYEEVDFYHDRRRSREYRRVRSPSPRPPSFWYEGPLPPTPLLSPYRSDDPSPFEYIQRPHYQPEIEHRSYYDRRSPPPRNRENSNRRGRRQ